MKIEINEESFNKIVDENLNTVRSENGLIELNDNGEWYPIEFERCSTHESIVNWVYHLSPKEWVTKKHIHLFISHAIAAHNLSLELLQD